MIIPLFVGREEELNILKSLFIKASKGNGSVVLVEGEAGIGKSYLISQFQKEILKVNDVSKVRFVYGYCYEDNGEQNAYQPFIEILSNLLEVNKATSSLAIMFLSILRETGVDWLNIIPGVGQGYFILKMRLSVSRPNLQSR